MERAVWAAVLAVFVCGCGNPSGSSSPMEGLVGGWLFTDSSGAGVAFIDFKADGTYAGGQVGGGEAEIEDGTWVATNTTIPLRP